MAQLGEVRRAASGECGGEDHDTAGLRCLRGGGRDKFDERITDAKAVRRSGAGLGLSESLAVWEAGQYVDHRIGNLEPKPSCQRKRTREPQHYSDRRR